MRSRLVLIAAAAMDPWLSHYADTLTAKALWEWIEHGDLSGSLPLLANFTRLQMQYNDRFYIVPRADALAGEISERLALAEDKLKSSVQAAHNEEDTWRLLEAVLGGPIIHPFPPTTARGLKIEMKQTCAELLALGNTTYARTVLRSLGAPADLVKHVFGQDALSFEGDELVDAVWRKQLNPVIQHLADETDDQALHDYLVDYLYSAQKLPVEDMLAADLQEGFNLNAFEGKDLDVFLLKDDESATTTATTTTTTAAMAPTKPPTTAVPKVRGTMRLEAEAAAAAAAATTGFIHGYETFPCDHGCEGLDYGAGKARSNDHGYTYLQEVSVVAPGIHVGADIDYNVLTGAGMWQSTMMFGTRPDAVGLPFCLGISEADWQWVNTKMEDKTYPTVLLATKRGPEWVDRYTPVAIWSALKTMQGTDTPTHFFVAPGYRGEFNADEEHAYPSSEYELMGRRCLETVDSDPDRWLISRRDYHDAITPLVDKVPLISIWFGLVQNRTNIAELGTPYVDHLKGHGIDLRVTWSNDTADTDWYDKDGTLRAHGMIQQ